MLVIDPETFDLPLTPERIRVLCHRHYGIGADGICYGPLPDSNHPHAMKFYNPDGMSAEKSGNGLRIFARYLWDKGYVSGSDYDIFINGEIVQAQVQDETAHTIRMTMGKANFDAVVIPVKGFSGEVVNTLVSLGGHEFNITAVSVGNPHCVIFGHEISEAAARRYGSIIETSPMFPNRINVQFAEVVDRHTLKIEIWERSAGYTLASGTSSCATAAAAVRTGRCDSPVEIRMPGGNVLVEVETDWSLALTGTVTAVAEGTLAPEFIEQLKMAKD